MTEHYWKTTFGALEYDPEVFLPIGDSFPSEEEAANAPFDAKFEGGSSPGMLDHYYSN